MNKWDQRFFQLCDVLASWSEDSSRKVGAVIVGPSNEVRSTGFNGLPRSISSSDEQRHSRDSGEKYYWFEHAERNAIFNAARAGIGLMGCKIYVSLFPCADCVRAIIQSGIIELNTFDVPQNDPTFSRSFEVAKAMIGEAGVGLKLFTRTQ